MANKKGEANSRVASKLSGPSGDAFGFLALLTCPSNSNSASADVPSCILPAETEFDTASDVYALKSASELTRVQRQ